MCHCLKFYLEAVVYYFKIREPNFSYWGHKNSWKNVWKLMPQKVKESRSQDGHVYWHLNLLSQRNMHTKYEGCALCRSQADTFDHLTWECKENVFSYVSCLIRCSKLSMQIMKITIKTSIDTFFFTNSEHMVSSKV